MQLVCVRTIFSNVNLTEVVAKAKDHAKGSSLKESRDYIRAEISRERGRERVREREKATDRGDWHCPSPMPRPPPPRILQLAMSDKAMCRHTAASCLRSSAIWNMHVLSHARSNYILMFVAKIRPALAVTRSHVCGSSMHYIIRIHYAILYLWLISCCNWSYY